MNKRILLSLSILFLMIINIFMPIMSSAAEMENKTVTIGYYESAPFEMGASEGEIKSGYAYEHYQKISEYTGWKYNYVYGEFYDLYQQLCDGKIDLLAGITYSDEKATQIGFPDISMGTKHYKLIKKSSNSQITADPQTLEGTRIGVVESDMTSELETWTADYGINASIKKYLTFNQVYNAFDKGVVDLIMMEDTRDYDRPDSEIFLTIGVDDYYLCVNKNKPYLLSKLNNAQSRIVSDNPHYFSNLYSKYYTKSISGKAFSVEELEWLFEHRELRIGYLDNLLPFADTDENGEVKGVICDYMPLLLEKLGLSDDIKVVYTGFDNFDDMVKAVNKGEIDVVFPSSGGLYFSEENGIHQSNPILTLGIHVVYQDEYSEKSNLKIAIDKNNKNQEYLVRQYIPEAEIVYFESIDDCLDAVNKKQVDATIVDGIRVNSLLRNGK